MGYCIPGPGDDDDNSREVLRGDGGPEDSGSWQSMTFLGGRTYNRGPPWEYRTLAQGWHCWNHRGQTVRACFAAGSNWEAPLVALRKYLERSDLEKRMYQHRLTELVRFKGKDEQLHLKCLWMMVLKPWFCIKITWTLLLKIPIPDFPGSPGVKMSCSQCMEQVWSLSGNKIPSAATQSPVQLNK